MNKKVILTFGIATLSCGLASSALVAADDTQFTVTVNPYLNVTLSGSDIHLPITPTSAGTYGDTYFTATASTNNAYGYKLNLSIKDGSAANANLTTDLKSNVTNVNTGVAPVIPTFSTNDVLTSSEFSASTSTDHINHWAMSINDTDHYKKVLSESTIATSDSPAIDDPTTINLATKLDLLTSPGSYSAYFNFEVVANPVPPESNPINTAMGNANKQPVTINGQQYYKMQDMTTAICNSITTPTASDSSDTPTAKLVDIRDNTIYTIGKLADGRCWLLDNLALDLIDTSLDSLQGNTNATNETLRYLKGSSVRDEQRDPNGNYATAGVAVWSSSDSLSAPLIYTADKDMLPTTCTMPGNNCSTGDDPLASSVISGEWKAGVYYNFCAASAGSFCYSDSVYTMDSTEDICPTGWRLPTGWSYDDNDDFIEGESGNLYYSYSGDEHGWGEGSKYANFRKALHFSLSGSIENSSFQDTQGYNGFFWASTIENDYNNILSAYETFIWTNDYMPLSNGMPVRCIAK